MYDHIIWSNQRILETLQNGADGSQEVNRLFSHILFGERIWITRLQGLDSSQLPVWGDVDMEICAELAQHNEERFKEFLNNLVDSGLDKLIFYGLNNELPQWMSRRKGIYCCGDAFFSVLRQMLG